MSDSQVALIEKVMVIIFTGSLDARVASAGASNEFPDQLRGVATPKPGARSSVGRARRVALGEAKKLSNAGWLFEGVFMLQLILQLAVASWLTPSGAWARTTLPRCLHPARIPLAGWLAELLNPPFDLFSNGDLRN